MGGYHLHFHSLLMWNTVIPEGALLDQDIENHFCKQNFLGKVVHI